MRKKIHTEKSPAISFQLGKDLVTFTDKKSPIVNILTEVGLTDWEIHMNQRLHLLENDSKLTVSNKKNLVVTGELKNTLQDSNYWFG